MIWWLVIVLVVVPLLVLGAAALPLLRQLGEFGVAARRLQLRAADAGRLVPAVTALQRRADEMRQELVAAQERARIRGER